MARATSFTLFTSLLFNNCTQILVRDPDATFQKPPLRLGPGAVRAMGFRDDEALLEYPRRSFTGYRVLQEYFAFPEKFFFIELAGLEQLAAAGFGSRAEVIFLISPYERSDRQEMLELGVSAKTFRLNCSPVVNLFPHTAEPIHLDQTRHEYPVIADIRRKNALEVISVDDAMSSNPRSQEIVHFDPIYSYRHAMKRRGGKSFLEGYAPAFRPQERRWNGSLGLAGGSVGKDRASRGGNVDCALYLQQSRSALPPAFWQ
jgi:type VI secretion system protein ImpG